MKRRIIVFCCCLLLSSINLMAEWIAKVTIDNKEIELDDFAVSSNDWGGEPSYDEWSRSQLRFRWENGGTSVAGFDKISKIVFYGRLNTHDIRGIWGKIILKNGDVLDNVLLQFYGVKGRRSGIDYRFLWAAYNDGLNNYLRIKSIEFVGSY